jgi:8-oxo-dGTP diphosphatase
MDVTEVVRAAGGLVCRQSDDGTAEGNLVEVLLVHRPAYDDWAFPKGKLEPGEREEQAALREVEEETGLHCRLGRDLGVTRYNDSRGRSKTVRYWQMTPIGGQLAPADGVDDTRWVSVPDATALLTYPRDRELLARLVELE